MKKFKTLIVSIVLIGAVFVNFMPSFALFPADPNCGEGCQSGFFCPYANRDYTKNMVSTLCDDGEHHENDCQLGTGCCCLVTYENDCPEEDPIGG